MSADVTPFTVVRGRKRQRRPPSAQALALATTIDRLRPHDPATVRTVEIVIDRAYRIVSRIDRLLHEIPPGA